MDSEDESDRILDSELNTAAMDSEDKSDRILDSELNTVAEATIRRLQDTMVVFVW